MGSGSGGHEPTDAKGSIAVVRSVMGNGKEYRAIEINSHYSRSWVPVSKFEDKNGN